MQTCACVYKSGVGRPPKVYRSVSVRGSGRHMRIRWDMRIREGYADPVGICGSGRDMRIREGYADPVRNTDPIRHARGRWHGCWAGKGGGVWNLVLHVHHHSVNP